MMNNSACFLAKSLEYQSFRSTIAQRKITIDNTKDSWTIYDAGPRAVRCPLIFLPPASGSADVFFKQLVFLSSVGYRVISVEYPSYWTHTEWTEGFKKLLDTLQLDKVHLFGASLGGFLAQKVAESTHINPRVHSMILCNSFCDTSVFTHNMISSTFWLMPSFALKRILLDGFNDKIVDKDVADSVDFMVERVEGMKRSQLASRLRLNCTDSYVEPQKLCDVNVTIIDVFDESALSSAVKEEMYKCYPDSRKAHLKNGGNFPYLSRSVEVNLYIQIHMRQFVGSRWSAIASEFERNVDNVQAELEDQVQEDDDFTIDG